LRAHQELTDVSRIRRPEGESLVTEVARRRWSYVHNIVLAWVSKEGRAVHTAS